MKIFILEDEPERIVQLATKFLDLSEHDVTWAASCAHEDRFEPPYDLLLLDHDLGGRQMAEHADNGATFLRLIVERLNPDAEVIFHSWNPEGAKNMASILTSWDKVAGTRRSLAAIAEFGSSEWKMLLNAALFRVEEGL